jgi:septum site-determining protein MinD
VAQAPRIVAVGGARDGVGKTSFVVNAALAFVKETRKRVLILDLDRDSVGDVQTLLSMGKVKTLADFAPYADKLSSNQLRQYISAHPAGIGVLPLAPDPAGAAPVTPHAVARLLELLKPICDYIIADCGVDIHDNTVKVFEQASGIFLLTTPDLLVLNHTRRFVDRLQRLHFPKELIKVILNRYDSAAGPPLDLITQKLARGVLAHLPEDAMLCRTAAFEGKPFVLSQPRAQLSRHYDEFIRKLVETQTLEKLGQVARAQGTTGLDGRAAGLIIGGTDVSKELKEYQKSRGTKAGRATADIDQRTAIKMLIHKRLVEAIDLKKFDKNLGDEDRDVALRKRVIEAVSRILDEVGTSMTDRGDRQRIVKEICDEALGLGPLEDFLADDRVSEIMVNRRDRVYVEIEGKLQLTNASFTDDAQLLGVIERIVAPIGRRIDEKSPMVDARLKDGSRVNAIIPPLALDGPCLTIRKFAREPLTVKDLVGFNSFTAEMADFLRACVEAHLNILISGGTGSGKTTLLNVMSSFIPKDERIITIEDSAELQLKQPHIVRLETRPANIEGEGAIHIRDLVRNSLRMRPDRIVVGECRGSEALDMLQAMNTGHDGSMTTIHSNSPRDCLARLETLVMFAGLDLPSKAIREQITSAINVIIQQSRLSDGTRRVTGIAEITGMEGQTITLQDIFIFKQTGLKDGKVQGRFVTTGFVPKFVHDLEARGIAMPRGIFAAGRPAVPQGRPAPGRGGPSRGRTKR